MDLKEAIRASNQILDDERVSPTVRYEATMPPQQTNPMLGVARTLMSITNLPNLRARCPREVLEDPTEFVFKSVNYDLLRAIQSQIPADAVPQYVRAVSIRLCWGVGCAASELRVYPKWLRFISEQPLVAEFLVRNGGKEDLFKFLRKEDLAVIPGHVLLLLQLEDMVALNYSVFTSSEYEQLSQAVKAFAHRARQMLSQFRTAVNYKEVGVVRANVFRHSLTEACSGIIEQCRRARYFYLKGSLLKGLNIEVNQDKAAVESYLRRFGFSEPLTESLSEAERLYQQQDTAFDCKSCMDHLRSFLEHLHREAIPSIQGKHGGSPGNKWGEHRSYLLRTGVLSNAEEQFVGSLYTMISDAAVHPLGADPEDARLARNVVIEYALLFLRKMEKLGLESTSSRLP